MLRHIRLIGIVGALLLGLAACSPDTAAPGNTLEKASSLESTGAASGGAAPTVATGATGAAGAVGATSPATPATPVAPSVPPATAANTTRPEPAVTADAPAARTTLPADTQLEVFLDDALSSATSKPGDGFSASLAEAVVVDGKTILSKGSVVRGRVVDVKDSGRVKGRASLHLTLTSVVSRGKTVPIKTKTHVADAEDSKSRDGKIIGGGAAVGAIIGAVAGGKKGAAEGAAIGAGAGTGTVLATKGEALEYPAETRLSFALASPVTL